MPRPAAQQAGTQHTFYACISSCPHTLRMPGQWKHVRMCSKNMPLKLCCTEERSPYLAELVHDRQHRPKLLVPCSIPDPLDNLEGVVQLENHPTHSRLPQLHVPAHNGLQGQVAPWPAGGGGVPCMQQAAVYGHAAACVCTSDTVKQSRAVRPSALTLAQLECTVRRRQSAKRQTVCREQHPSCCQREGARQRLAQGLHQPVLQLHLLWAV